MLGNLVNRLERKKNFHIGSILIICNSFHVLMCNSGLFLWSNSRARWHCYNHDVSINTTASLSGFIIRLLLSQSSLVEYLRKYIRFISAYFTARVTNVTK